MAQPTSKPFQSELNNFRALNASDHPRNIADDELAALIGFMPVGRSLKTVRSTSSYADLSASLTIRSVFECNFSGAVRYLVAFSDGSLYRYNNTFGSPTLVAAAGTFTVPAFAQWVSPTTGDRVLIIDPTAGYFSYDNATLSAKISTYVGTSIAVYKQRAFIANGRNYYYSDPDDFTGFAAGGGAAKDNYPSLGTSIIKLVAQEDYLYLIGDKGTHILHGIQILADASTAFTLSDSLPGIGTNELHSISTWKNAIWLWGIDGITVIQGASYNVVSGPIVDLLNVVSSIGASFFVRIHRRIVFCVSVQLTSPLSGQVELWLLCFTEGKWFCVKTDIFYDRAITSHNFENVYALPIATSTAIVYSAFLGSAAMLRKVRTKAFSFGSSTKNKQIIKVGVIATASGLTPTVQAISDRSGSAALLPPDAVPDSGDYLYSKEIDARGKSVAFDYEETSATQYTLSGLILEGTTGADW